MIPQWNLTTFQYLEFPCIYPFHFPTILSLVFPCLFSLFIVVLPLLGIYLFSNFVNSHHRFVIPALLALHLSIPPHLHSVIHQPIIFLSVQTPLFLHLLHFQSQHQLGTPWLLHFSIFMAWTSGSIDFLGYVSIAPAILIVLLTASFLKRKTAFSPT